MDCDDEQIIYWTYIKRPKGGDEDFCERPQKRPRPPDDVYQRLYDKLRACYRDAFLVYQDTVLECDRRLGCSDSPEVVSKVDDPVNKVDDPVKGVKGDPVNNNPVSKEACDPVTSANKAIGSSARYAF